MTMNNIAPFKRSAIQLGSNIAITLPKELEEFLAVKKGDIVSLRGKDKQIIITLEQ